MSGKRVESSVQSAIREAGFEGMAPGSREKLESYAREVHVWSERMHLVGKSRLGRNVGILVLDSLLLLRAAEESGLTFSNVADIGSGAGFPGVVWKIVRPDLEMTLFERRLKPGLFLERAAIRLGLAGVSVIGGDAANAGDAGAFDLVVSKAAGRLTGILPIAERLLRPGGVYLTIKGRSWESEIPGEKRGPMRFESAQEFPGRRGVAVLFRKQETP